MSFEQPQYLLLILLALPVVIAGLRWLVSMSLVRRWSAVILRVALVGLIAAMLAGLSAVRTTDRLAVIGVLDISGSVRRFADGGVGPGGRPVDPIEAARDFFERAAAERGPDDLLGLVVFDGRALAVATPSRAGLAGRPIDLRPVEGTNIADAIRYAAALVPPDTAGRLVLVSDGNQTSGDAVRAAQEVAARGSIGRGVSIDVVPLVYNVRNEVIVEAVDAPPQAAAESTITVRVVLNATDGASGTLYLLREGEPVDINGGEPGVGRRLSLPPGPHVETISVELEPTKLHRFRAVWEPEREVVGNGAAVPIGDTHAENNAGEAFTITPGKGAVLLVDGVSGGDPAGPGATLAGALRENAIDVTIVGPEGVPDNLLSLQAYDLVILQNVPAEALQPRIHELLAAHVSDAGGGLVMVGGPDSFGAGGWKGSALEPILPVKLDLPEKLVVPSAAIVFVLDNSGSMRSGVMSSLRSQQEIANEAAALAVRTLDQKDLVSVVTFNDSSNLLVPLGPNTDPGRTAERILSIGSGGGTNLPPALDEASRQLSGVEAKIKHVIVLSDGRSAGAEILPGMAARMHAQGITVSTIAVGDEADEVTMAQVAASGGGTFYAVNNPEVLPRIFLKAVRVVRSPLIRETPFRPVVLPTGSPLVAGLGTPPPLGGLVLTQARQEPTITYAMAAPGGEPVLAHWNVELGQVAAFTSDAHRWASAWLDWPGYGRFWTQLARTLARPAASGDFRLVTQIDGDRLHLRLDAVGEDGRPADLLTVPATVYAPSGEQFDVTLAQTGPGLYEAEAAAPESGTYVAIVKPRLGPRALAPIIGGASVASGAEFRSLRSDAALLRRVAEEAGGRILSFADADAAALFDRRGIRPSEARLPLWRPLLIAAILVLLLDIATRRIAWDRWTSREFGAGLRQAAAEAVRDRSEQAARAIGSLRGRAAAPAGAGLGAGMALSDEDAKRLAAAAADRRRQMRLAAAQAARNARLGSPAGPGPASQASPSQPAARGAPPVAKDAPPRPAEEQGTSGLLAAKRRARERFEGSDEA